MSMYTCAMLNAWLKDILVKPPRNQRIALRRRIVLLTSPDAALSEYLYIGTCDDLVAATSGKSLGLHSMEDDRNRPQPPVRKSAPAAGICLISAGPCSVLADICIPEHITLIETSCRFWNFKQSCPRISPPVPKHVPGILTAANRRYQCRTAGTSGTGLQRTSGYHSSGQCRLQKIAAVYDPHIQDSTADELRENGYQSFDTIQSIHHQQVVKRGENMEYAEYISDLSHNYTIVRLIHYRGELVARLCVILDGPATDPCISDFNELLSRYVADYMLSNHRTDYSGNAQFGALAADLIECRIANEEELQQRLKQIKLATRRYYHVMLINFPSDTERNKNIPWNYIINQLEYLFPFSNITTYKGEILLLIRKMKRRSRLSFNQKRC